MPPHIAVCICTYKRPGLLQRLLKELGVQETGSLFTYSVVIVDNDQGESAKPVAARFEAESHIPVRYCVQSQQSIALTRNKAVESAEGDYLAFIDDDEFPTRRWLLTLYNACQKYAVDGVL